MMNAMSLESFNLMFYDLLDVTEDELVASNLIVSDDGLNLSVNELEIDSGMN